MRYASCVDDSHTPARPLALSFSSFAVAMVDRILRPILELGSSRERDYLVRDYHTPIRPLPGKLNNNSVAKVVLYVIFSIAARLGEGLRSSSRPRRSDPGVEQQL